MIIFEVKYKKEHLYENFRLSPILDNFLKIFIQTS